MLVYYYQIQINKVQGTGGFLLMYTIGHVVMGHRLANQYITILQCVCVCVSEDMAKAAVCACVCAFLTCFTVDCLPCETQAVLHMLH